MSDAADAGPGTRRVHEIDLLRFAAALSVVIFHYAFRGHAADAMSVMPYPLLEPAARYGYLGVQLFFMISGFVILMTATRGGLGHFIGSRALRLYPAFWVCCSLTFAATLAFGAPRYVATLPQFLANLTLMGDFLGVEPIDGVYWSLVVEMRFYLLVAVVLALGAVRHVEGLLLAWLIAILTLLAFPSERLGTMLLKDHAACFIGGAASYLIWSRGPSVRRLALLGASWLMATAQSVAASEILSARFGSLIDGGVVSVIVSFFFLLMLMVALGLTAALGRVRWTLLGELTYPLYLLHENIGFMVFNAAYPHWNAHLLFWGTLCAMLLASAAIERWVSRQLTPALKAGFAGASRRLGRMPTA